ncbi:putative RNA methyltransferase [Gordonia hirsuta DSM 44140 = NBRC 16056]|uniref:Putative RNA methyltransferase n=1 Tax=Gordonia hirsuta DSM 44140 = NBRC 16056 TaxID=1121927 RepID=L7L8T0_9ACTN|nr:RNA methyltransferase [Gordonia hirsuta]GAC57535.1 putative RNA methyltransferase [Gordonia hirsuta DSM 44140 = NBRC 16056]
MHQPLPVEIIDITAPHDRRVDDFRDLNSSTRRPDLTVLPGGRTGRGLVVAEGVSVVARMAGSRFSPHAFLGVDKRLSRLIGAGVLAAGPAAVPFYRVDPAVMEQIVGFHLNRGVLGVAHRPAPLTVAGVIDARVRTVVVLEGVNDHENIGSIFRNAAGLGVDAVIVGGGCADPLYRRSIRVSMGHVLRVPFASSREWPQDLGLLSDAGFTLVALTPDAGAVPLTEAVTEAKTAFLVGAEGPGLAEDTMRRCDVRAAIPMSRDTDSLNVATAAAIAFYERARR